MTQASSSQGQLKLPLPIIAPIQECIHSWLGGGWGGGQPANTGAFVSSTGSVVNETPKYNAMAGVTSTTSFSQVVPPPSGQDTVVCVHCIIIALRRDINERLNYKSKPTQYRPRLATPQTSTRPSGQQLLNTAPVCVLGFHVCVCVCVCACAVTRSTSAKFGTWEVYLVL